MKWIGRWLLILIILGGGIAGFLWFRARSEAGSQDDNILRTAQVIQDDLPLAVSASGNVAVNDSIDLRFGLPGTVRKIAVDVDQRVTAGQVLAQLDTTELQSAVSQARIALEQARLNLETVVKPVPAADLELAELTKQNAAQALEVARIGRQTAQADASELIVQAQRARENAFTALRNAEGTEKEENARAAFVNAEEQERIAKINANLTIEQAQAQWLSAYNRFQQAEQSLKTLQEGPDRFQVRQADLQIEQATITLEQAEASVADATLTAPFGGVIAAINIQEDVLAPSNTPAFTLIDDTRYYIDVTVDEIDVGKVAVGQEASITLDAYPGLTLPGTVDTIAPAALNIGGIVSYQVRILLGETGDAMPRNGMTANVLIRTGVITDIVLVPNWAVRTGTIDGETRTFCYRVQPDGGLEQAQITLGRYNDTFTEVLTGLNVGDTVALVVEERNLLEFSGPPSRGR